MLQLRENWSTKDCFQPKQGNEPCAPATVVNQHMSLAPRSDCANYTTMEEILTGEEMLAGTFFLNERPITILFNYGESHDFMSSTCAKKVKLTLVASGATYMISTTRSRLDVDQII
jgi:hypothetical protein